MTVEMTGRDYERRIAALLNKAERTDNRAEAEAFSAKAEELMIKWGVDDATLAAARKTGDRQPERIVTHEFGDLGSTMQPANLRLVYAVVQGLGLRAYTLSYGKVQTLVAVGFESDVRRAQLLVASIRLQATTALRDWWAGRSPDDPRIVDRKFWMSKADQTAARRQFAVSFGVAVKNRLEARRTEVVAAAGTGAELAVRDRGTAVDEWMIEHLDLRDRNSRMRGSFDGAAAGRAAGGRASLNDAAVRGGRTQLGR